MWFVFPLAGILNRRYIEPYTARFDRRPEDYTVIGIECDVSSERSVQKAYSKVMDTFGRIDAVVASAGIVENYSAFE